MDNTVKEFLNFLLKNNMEKLAKIKNDIERENMEIDCSIAKMVSHKMIDQTFAVSVPFGGLAKLADLEDQKEAYSKNIGKYKEKFEELLCNTNDEKNKKIYEIILKNI